ncbi:S1C family serine protease [Bradyrhizobium sp. WSM3983]|uniref:S1C family serine protease n=1 Tax=Bradyrhizobium sp. WSM3983 TaxID=1038867 RepID=UPI00041B2DCA|nr:trypsin-like peptidase domain-containing protein [Bradyrhizobium sp. WSM3983]
MEAVMAGAGLIRDWRRSSAIGGTVAVAILMIASLAQGQPVNFHGQPLAGTGHAVWQHQVADASHASHDAGPGSFADLAEKVAPAVIAVSAMTGATLQAFPNRRRGPRNENPAPDTPEQGQDRGELVSMGSGFLISPDGYAVTNSHVVEDSDTAEIRTSDNKIYSAKVIGKDALSDLALIKVEGRSDFAYVKLADRPPRVGDWVLAVGNSFGLGGSVTAGIVSARGRNLEISSSEDFLQIDAPINNGASGGPSFNTQGEVVGVNSMILSPGGGSAGVAFAIPADTVKAVIPQLKDSGAVTRGWIGAEVQSVTPDIAEVLAMNNPHGAIVVSVQDNGPAAKAGLRSGDVISSLRNEPIKSANELTKKIHVMAPGSSAQFTVLRQGKESPLSVTLGRLPNQSSSPAANPR